MVKKLNILIYEDNINDIEILKIRTNTFLSQYHISYKIDVCPNTEFLIANIYQYDFLFLDIEVNDENGIKIGEIVKKKHRNCHIIITSGYKKYLIDGYTIKAERYLLKPFSQTYFNLQMKNVIDEYFRDSVSIYDPKISKQRIPLKKIICIEYFEKHSYLRLTNHTTLKTAYPLHYWLEKYNNHYFARCHKSFIANCIHVIDIDDDYVLLDNDSKIPLSRHFKKAFIDSWLESVQDTL